MTKQGEEKLIKYIKIWFEGRQEANRNEVIDKFLAYQNKARSFMVGISTKELLETAVKAGIAIRNRAYTPKERPAEPEKYVPVIPESDLRRLYADEKMKIKDIAAKYNVDTERVYYLLYSYDIPSRTQRIDISKEQVQEAYENNPPKEAGKKLGISHVTMFRLIEKYGIEKRGRRRVS